ncbi:unnamed protein product, partial [Polarella glacialis]
VVQGTIQAAPSQAQVGSGSNLWQLPSPPRSCSPSPVGFPDSTRQARGRPGFGAAQ